MSIGPVTGNGIPISIPQNKFVFWSVLVQSSANQFIQIKNSGGQVVFTANGASSSGGTPTQIGQGVFQANDPSGNYTVWLGVNGGQNWSKVIWTQDVLTDTTKIYAGKYIFTTEDGSDNDYNDSYLQIQWFAYAG